MNRNSGFVIGAVLIAIGVLFMLSNFGYVNFSFNYLWPMALLIPGIYMHFAFFTGIDKNPGILVPAGILTTYGGLFLVNVLFGWQLMGSLWPFFILGVAIGLFELYLFGNRDKGLLIPVAILGAVGFTALSGPVIQDLKKYATAVILIIVGVSVILNSRNKK